MDLGELWVVFQPGFAQCSNARRENIECSHYEGERRSVCFFFSNSIDFMLNVSASKLL